MPESNVIAFGMSDETLRRRIAQIAGVSGRVFITPHARTRMRKRGVLRPQVLSVLRKGRVVEHAHQNIYRNWQCTLEDIVAGDRIKVVAAVETSSEGGLVIVITVMN